MGGDKGRCLSVTQPQSEENVQTRTDRLIVHGRVVAVLVSAMKAEVDRSGEGIGINSIEAAPFPDLDICLMGSIAYQMEWTFAQTSTVVADR